jgi:hypothetical protein
MSSLGIASLLAVFLGMFGVDKFYIGQWQIGLIQLLLTLSIVGGIVSIPWQLLSISVLVGGILFSSIGLPLCCYPEPVDGWLPLTQTDKVIAWIIVGLAVISLFSGAHVSISTYKKFQQTRPKVQQPKKPQIKKR